MVQASAGLSLIADLLAIPGDCFFGAGAMPCRPLRLLIHKARRQLRPARDVVLTEKKTKGRKRHIAVDTMGNLLFIKVHAANSHDTVSGGSVFTGVLVKYPSIEGACVDAGYRKTSEDVVKAIGKTVTISEKLAPKIWAILPKRWIVERTLSWLNHSRRLSKDCEISTASEESMVVISHLATLSRRLARL